MMEQLTRMHLTDDEIVAFHTRNGIIGVRMRIWQHRDCRPLLIVEQANARGIWPHAGRIATYAKHILCGGVEPVYVERSAPATWFLVTFTPIRHHLMFASRSLVSQDIVTWTIGQTIEE